MSNLRNHETVFRMLLWTQASYTMITALWPLVDIDSFMTVTGPKEDIWLVKTVGALLVPVAASLYAHLFISADKRPAIILGSLTAGAFICVDVYYALTDVISDIYLADAAVESIFLAGWIYVVLKERR